MAYTETYTVQFTNEQNQDVLATIYKKNGPVVTVENYMAVAIELNDRSEGQTKYESTIISRELYAVIWSEDSNAITWETFITAEHDEWKIDVRVDNQLYFEGFITPDEGNAPFQDKPYEVAFRATNGLALLKDIELIDHPDGSQFGSNHTLIDYIAGALLKTGLELPIHIKCGYFNTAHQDKDDGLQYDMFSQTYLNYRTFLKDPTTFVSCYEALMIILDKFCRLEYWNGVWLITNIAELQYLRGHDYVVYYDSDGAMAGGVRETDNHGQIGKAVDIYPINEDQQVYSRFAIKSAKTTFNYTPWPEIPKNNKFGRGNIIVGQTGNVYEKDDNGNDTATQIGTYQDYEILNWDYGTFNGTPTPIAQLPSLSAGTDAAVRRTTKNAFGIEISREIIIGKSTTNTQVLQSEGLAVYVGDKVSISFDFRLSFNFGAQLTIATVHVYIKPTAGGNPYWWRDGAGFTNKWRRNGGASEALNIEYIDSSEPTKVYKSFSLTSPAIPVDGTLYIMLTNVMDNNTPNEAWYRNFDFTYTPFIAGGYVQVKADYWLRTQNKVFPDVANDTVRISDSPKKMLQGSLLLPNGELTSPTWFRYNAVGNGNPGSESFHFKELLNIARYNHSYRRMYALDGSFNGLNYSPENNQLNKYPIRMNKRYRLVDMVSPRDFVLVPPMKMDLIKGWINASMVEVIQVSAGDTDGEQTGDSSSFNYVFENTNA
jgi:hypothetical protein